MSSPFRQSTPPDDPTTILLTHLTTSTTLVDDLHASLLSSLHRSGWTERIRQLSYELLREGHCERFDEMMEVVCELVGGNKSGLTPAAWRGIKRKRRMEEDEDEDDDDEEEEDGGSRTKNGVDKSDDETKLPQTFVGFDVTLPESVVKEAVGHIKRAMHEVFEFEGDEDDTEYNKDVDRENVEEHEDADGDVDADGDAEGEYSLDFADADADAEPDDEFADLIADTDNMFELDTTTGFNAPSQTSQQHSYQAMPPDIPSTTGSTKQNGATGKKWKTKSAGSSHAKR